MDKELVAIFGTAVLLVAAVFCGAMFLSEKSCKAKTTSFTSSYFSVLAGCMVEIEDGRFMPLENYREM